MDTVLDKMYKKIKVTDYGVTKDLPLKEYFLEEPVENNIRSSKWDAISKIHFGNAEFAECDTRIACSPSNADFMNQGKRIAKLGARPTFNRVLFKSFDYPDNNEFYLKQEKDGSLVMYENNGLDDNKKPLLGKQLAILDDGTKGQINAIIVELVGGGAGGTGGTAIDNGAGGGGGETVVALVDLTLAKYWDGVFSVKYGRGGKGVSKHEARGGPGDPTVIKTSASLTSSYSYHAAGGFGAFEHDGGPGGSSDFQSDVQKHYSGSRGANEERGNPGDIIEVRGVLLDGDTPNYVTRTKREISSGGNNTGGAGGQAYINTEIITEDIGGRGGTKTDGENGKYGTGGGGGGYNIKGTKGGDGGDGYFIVYY